MDIFTILFWFCISMGSGIFCMKTAQKKGRSSWWFLAGFILSGAGILAVIAAENITLKNKLIHDISILEHRINVLEKLRNPHEKA